VSIASDHNFYVGFSGDISEGGLFIATRTVRELGAVVLLGFTLPDEDAPIEALGIVRWVRSPGGGIDGPPGMGIRFVELSIEATEAITRFVHSREPLFWG